MKNYQQIVPLQEGKTIFVKAHAPLDIEGWSRNEIKIDTDLNVQRIRQEDDGLYLLFVDNARLYVPENSSLVVQKASGNARIRKMKGKVEVSSVMGNLAVQQAGEVEIGRVSGGCLVQDIEGPLSIHSVSGALKGKDLHSEVRANRISAGVELIALHAGADIRASGDIRLSFLSDSEMPVRLRSAASIYLNLPFGLNAEIKIRSNAQLTELVLGDRKEKINYRKHTILVGEGRRKFDLDASGKIRIIAEKIEDEEILSLFEELEMLWDELNKERKARRKAKEAQVQGKPAVDEGIDLSIEEMKLAEERVETAIQQVETRLESMGYRPDTGSNNTSGNEEGEPSDNTGERLIIMKLLGEKKISLEEADKLLEALEQHKWNK